MKKSNILLFLGSLIYPIYFFPFMISSILKSERIGYLLFSFCLACLAYTMIPYDTMDITRYYEIFNEFQQAEFAEIFEYGRNVDLIFFIYSWLLLNIGFTKEFIPFSTTFIAYSLIFSSFFYITHFYYYNSQKKNNSLIFLNMLGFILLFSQIRFMDAASGLRNALAISIFVYAFSKWFISEKKLVLFTLFSIVAILVHASILIVIITLFLSYFISNRSILKFTLVISYLLLITGITEIIFYSGISILEPLLREYNLYYPSYFDPDGVWGAGYFEDANLNTIIFEKYIKPFPLYIAGLYFIIEKNFIHKVFSNFLISFFILIACVSISRTLFDRLGSIFVILFIFFLMIELSCKKLSLLKQIFLLFFISSLMIMNIGSVYKYRDVYIKSWTKMFVIPMPALFLDSIEPDQYIIRNSGE